jgi:hypothetical protein
MPLLPAWGGKWKAISSTRLFIVFILVGCRLAADGGPDPVMLVLFTDASFRLLRQPAQQAQGEQEGVLSHGRLRGSWNGPACG